MGFESPQQFQPQEIPPPKQEEDVEKLAPHDAREENLAQSEDFAETSREIELGQELSERTPRDEQVILDHIKNIEQKTGAEYKPLLNAARRAIEDGRGNQTAARNIIETLDVLLPEKETRRAVLKKLTFAAGGILLAGSEDAAAFIGRLDEVSVDTKNWIETYTVKNAMGALPEFEFTFIPGDRKKGEEAAKGVHFASAKPIDVLLGKGKKTMVTVENKPYGSFDDTTNPIATWARPENQFDTGGSRRRLFRGQSGKYHRAQYINLWEQKSAKEKRRNVALIERKNIQSQDGEWLVTSFDVPFKTSVEKGNISLSQGTVEFSTNTQNKNAELLHFVPMNKAYGEIEYEGETYISGEDYVTKMVTREQGLMCSYQRKSDGKILKEISEEKFMEQLITSEEPRAASFILCTDYNIENLPDTPPRKTYRIDLKPLRDKTKSMVEVRGVYDVSKEMDIHHQEEIQAATEKTQNGNMEEEIKYGGRELPPTDPIYLHMKEKAEHYFQPVVKIEHNGNGENENE